MSETKFYTQQVHDDFTRPPSKPRCAVNTDAMVQKYFCRRGCGAKFLTAAGRDAHEQVMHDKRKG